MAHGYNGYNGYNGSSQIFIRRFHRIHADKKWILFRHRKKSCELWVRLGESAYGTILLIFVVDKNIIEKSLTAKKIEEMQKR